MQRGDWLELRDAPNTRGMVMSVHGDRVTMLLSGDYDLTTHLVSELRERWEPMRFDGDPPPFWLRRKAVFIKMDPRSHDEDLYAEIADAKPGGWVAYYAKYALRSRAPCFFITKFWEFRKLYEPLKPPSAWDRVLLDLDD